MSGRPDLFGMTEVIREALEKAYPGYLFGQIDANLRIDDDASILRDEGRYVRVLGRIDERLEVTATFMVVPQKGVTK